MCEYLQILQYKHNIHTLSANIRFISTNVLISKQKERFAKGSLFLLVSKSHTYKFYVADNVHILSICTNKNTINENCVSRL